MTEPNKHVLVVGDVIRDISWIVEPVSRQSTSQFHGGIVPQRMVAPRAKPEMLGGAATIARRLLIHGMDVTLAGAWSDDLQSRLSSLIPPQELSASGRQTTLAYARIATTAFDTVKWRIYTRQSGTLRFVNRFDQDLEAPDVRLAPLALPDPTAISAVIVADVRKGLLAQTDLLTFLALKYRGLPFFLRSKHPLGLPPDPIRVLPWTVFLPNREDLAHLLGDSHAVSRAFCLMAEETDAAEVLVNPQLLRQIASFRSRLTPQPQPQDQPAPAWLAVKLDREGAIVLEPDQTVTAYALRTRDQGKWSSVSAGDVFMSDLASYVLSNHASPYSMAVRSATSYCRTAEKIDHGDWYGRLFTLPAGPDCDVIVRRLGPLDRLLADCTEHIGKYDTHFAAPHSGDLTVRLRDARWHLDGFVTVNTGLGEAVDALANDVKAYVQEDNESRRPAAYAICGRAGSGKSTVGRAIARAIGSQLIETNVSQWRDIEDLFSLCEKVRTHRIREKGRLPVVFIDEVDALVQGESVYGKLLAPLWDGAYWLRGEERTIGPTVFLLAGSTREWEAGKNLVDYATKGAIEEPTPDSLLGKLVRMVSARRQEAARSPSKLLDLVSRLRLVPLTVPPLTTRREDIPYVVCLELKRRFPGLQKVDRRLYHFLVRAEYRCEGRSITNALASLGLQVKDGILESPVWMTSIDDAARSGWQDTLELHITVGEGFRELLDQARRCTGWVTLEDAADM